MATHSSIPAWRIPWMEGPGGRQSRESQRVGEDGTTDTNGCVSLTAALVQALRTLCARSPVRVLDVCVHTPICSFSSIQETAAWPGWPVGMAPGVGPAMGTVWPPAPPCVPVHLCVSAHVRQHSILARLLMWTHALGEVRGMGGLSELRGALRGQEREGQALGGRVTLFSPSSSGLM